MSNEKMPTARELGEMYAKQGRSIKDNPYLGSQITWREFNAGYTDYQNTHNQK